MQPGLRNGYLHARGTWGLAAILIAALMLAACGEGESGAVRVATDTHDLGAQPAAADSPTATATSATTSASSSAASAGTNQTLAGPIVAANPVTGVSSGSQSSSTGSSGAASSSASSAPATATTATTSASSSSASTAGSPASSPSASSGSTLVSTPAASHSSRVALLSWTPPLHNTDGTMLTDLSGYRVYTGQDPNNLRVVADLPWGGYLWVQLKDLNPGIWYFSIRSYNSIGVESDFAPVVSKQVT